MSNKEVLDKLKTIYQGAKLPASSQILFTLNSKSLIMTLYYPDHNMQTNEAAFDAWAILIKTAYGNEIDEIIIEVDIQNNREINQFHFNRFLMRLIHFEMMYNWVKIGNCRNHVNQFKRNVYPQLRVNQALIARKAAAIPTTGKYSENYIESLFAYQYQFDLNCLTGSTRILNQVPVGLFDGKVLEKNRITPSKKSAIDLIGVDDVHKDVIHLYELKITDNDQVGIISEFLFYGFVLRSIFITKEIKFDGKVKVEDFSLLGNMIEQNTVTKIRGYFLFNTLHPLITSTVIDFINTGLNPLQISIERMSYDFIPPCIISNIRLIS